MKICAVTCTGARWDLFDLCAKWVQHQVRQPDLWIVAVDTDEPMPDVDATMLRIPKMPDGWKHRFGPASWALGQVMRSAPDDMAIVVMEDDDYYMPSHIETIERHLSPERPMTFGDTELRFNLPASRWQQLATRGAVEGVVGLLPSYRDHFIKTLESPKRWLKQEWSYPGYTSIGIKGVGFGLPGRAGVTRKHITNHFKVTKKMRPDPDHTIFRKHLGQHADDYLRLLKK
jgi:hypothetical protein